MKSRNFSQYCKNAVGTVFLLGGAFLTCSTLMSMRAAFADPIAPANTAVASAQSQRSAGATRSGRASPRASSANTTVSRETTATVAPSRRTTSRNVTARTTTRATVPARNVVARTATTAATRTTANRSGRNVVARNVDTSRISLQGAAIRSSKAATSSSYTFLNNKLYTGNYSTIIDSSTGLISAEAYNNCMESYYTCMDEICTARNAAQRRCACAGRVKAFADAENQLETANEELIKVSGELALLIANKGKDVSTAFQLTDAEKVMNCVSWKDMSNQFSAKQDADGNSKNDDVEWCQAHGIYDETKCSANISPDYCKDNTFGFDVDNINGTGSDILASLQAYSKAIDDTLTITTKDEQKLYDAFGSISNVVDDLTGITGAYKNADTIKDSLAETWGYELFEYAHNNVCSRVLDSCFNGIYETCGEPKSGSCGNGQSQCPYNYNSQIKVDYDNGEYNLNFITANTGSSVSNSATCFGYSSASGDPYAALRKPVADARRSIMQKYALDANADCDVYGEQLRQTAQNIGYQKVAAQQALQQKRLEFAIEEAEAIESAAVRASSNYDACISELYECYDAQLDSHGPGNSTVWTVSRIKTYCAQIANVPSCYEEMVCNPSMAQFKAVIDKADATECTNSQDYTTNTCRNIVTLNDILNGTGASETDVTAINEKKSNGTLYGDDATVNSAALRESCLRETIGTDENDETKIVIRTWLDDEWKKMNEKVDND